MAHYMTLQWCPGMGGMLMDPFSPFLSCRTHNPSCRTCVPRQSQKQDGLSSQTHVSEAVCCKVDSQLPVFVRKTPTECYCLRCLPAC